jgi:hypothetical protein
MIDASEEAGAVATPRGRQRGGAGRRLMHDIRPSAEGGMVAADLAAAFGVTTPQAEAALSLVAAEFGVALEQITLSRAGLASVIEATGGRWILPLDRCGALHSQTVRAGGIAALEEIVGSCERGRSLAARVERAGRLGEGRAEQMLPALAAVAVSRLASRARDELAEVVGTMPSLGRSSRGEPHLDLAEIVRRKSGSGPHGPVRLRHAARRALARAAGFTPRGAMWWYLRFIATPVVVPVGWAMKALRANA